MDNHRTIYLTYVSEVHVKVNYEDIDLHRELRKLFSFHSKGYMYSPKYKAGVWDGKIYLYSMDKQLLFIGLIPDLIEYCRGKGIAVKLPTDLLIPVDTSNHLNDVLGRISYTPRDYQVSIYQKCLGINKAIALSPTASGKSLMIYLIADYIVRVNKAKVLIIVPTVDLVSQMESDFIEYTKNPGDLDIKKVSGQSKVLSSDINISTWQMIYKESDEYFSSLNTPDFDRNSGVGCGCIIFDECHLVEAKSLTGIIEKSKEIPFRYGFSGTLKDAKSSELTLRGHIGSVIKNVTTSQLIERGEVSDLEIHQILLEYDNVPKLPDYASEIKYIVSHEKRTDFIVNTILSNKKNTLVLFTQHSHGEAILEKLTGKTDRKIFYITGKTERDDRKIAREISEVEDSVIILASYGVFSTGISIKNLHVTLFASPYKSKTKVLQSIGRTIRLHASKNKARIIDITDVFPTIDRKNYLREHGEVRNSMYKSENFSVKIIKLKLFNSPQQNPE